MSWLKRLFGDESLKGTSSDQKDASPDQLVALLLPKHLFGKNEEAKKAMEKSNQARALLLALPRGCSKSCRLTL